MKKCDVIVDLQFGSTGKGAIAGYLANKSLPYDAAVSANMPNAGHTFIDAGGCKLIQKVLPSAIASQTPIAILAPAAVFSVDQLIKELNVLEMAGYIRKAVYIHESAVVLTSEHKAEENLARPGSVDVNGFEAIGSTQQGSGAALIDKIRRDPHHNPTVGHNFGLGYSINDDPRIFVVNHAQYLALLADQERILIEGSQGYSLGINAGFYPYCTSRDCTVARLLADCLIPPTWVNRVIGVARTYPIRVGGTSGPGYPDQEEITWERIGQPKERTTVTNRVRRVFTFSHQQLREAIQQNAPTDIFLNFCNYLTEAEVSDMVLQLNKYMHDINGFGRVSFLGWGATIRDIKELVQ